MKITKCSSTISIRDNARITTISLFLEWVGEHENVGEGTLRLRFAYVKHSG